MSVRSSRRTPLINGAVADTHVAVFDGTTGAIKDGGVPAGTGTVTNTGTLTANQVVIGNGGVDVKVLGTLGTTTTVLHGNAAGAPTYGAVNVAAGGDITGDLPFANFVQASAASKLVGRGSASGAGDFEEVSLGTGLSMSGTTLSATGSGGTVTTTGSPASGNLTKFSGAASVTNADLTGDVTTAGGVATTIANNAVTTVKITDANVTLAKIANAAANSKLVGSGATGSGSAYSEISLGTGLSMSGTTLSATGTGGTVTTTGSPASGNLTKFSGAASITNGDLSGDVTTSGTLATTIANDAVTTAKILNANVTLAKIANAAASSKLLGSGSSGSGAAYSELTVGSGLSISGTTITASGGSSGRSTLQMCYGATTGWNPGDGAVAYFGLNTGFNPSATTDGGFRVIAPITGTVQAVYMQIQVTGTLGSAAVNSTFELRNVTANANETISAVVQYSATTQNYSNEAMTLAVTKGDALLIKCTMGTWGTNPTATFGYMTVVMA